MKANQSARSRQQAIVKHLRSVGRAQVDELAVLFRATPQTIRKDLKVLATEGSALRFHGGASLVAGNEYTEIETRALIASEQKDQIGRIVAARVPNNSSVLLNAGTTTAAVVTHLAGHAGLSITTDSVDLAAILRRYVGVDVMMPAGIVRASDGAIVGSQAVDFIRNFRADIGIIGAAAIGEDGSWLDYDLREASVATAMIKSARTVILVADASKFGRSAPVRFGHLNDIDLLAIDKGCPDDLRELCLGAGVDLLQPTAGA